MTIDITPYFTTIYILTTLHITSIFQIRKKRNEYEEYTIDSNICDNPCPIEYGNCVVSPSNIIADTYDPRIYPRTNRRENQRLRNAGVGFQS